MKITINHVHSGNVEVNLKEEPKAATEQKETEKGNSKHEKLKWALIGSLVGIGGSIPATFIVDMIKDASKATHCGDSARLVLSIVVFLIILCFSSRIAKD